MNPNTLRRVTFWCWATVSILLTATGCSRWIEMAPPSEMLDPGAQQIARDEQVPLIIDVVHTTRNGSPQHTSVEMQQRILGSLAEIGLFSHLSSGTHVESPSNDKIVRAKILLSETIDPHAGGAAWKGIVIGASMYTLTPFLPLEYGYAANVTLELERWDGQVKRYEGRSAGTARYQLFGATPIMIEELKGHVTESCLNELAKQIIRDTAFYTASSAPISRSDIRTVSIRRLSPRTPDASSTPIPISVSAPADR
ncbi:MAG TPA: hypothetical protein VFQ02_00060 [Nitrospira sp.]|nr:hypothetical protein [Nitrospira sp.]